VHVQPKSSGMLYSLQRYVGPSGPFLLARTKVVNLPGALEERRKRYVLDINPTSLLSLGKRHLRGVSVPDRHVVIVRDDGAMSHIEEAL
jgi:hypothetical protein